MELSTAMMQAPLFDLMRQAGASQATSRAGWPLSADRFSMDQAGRR
jgi:hypothetical protein